MKLKDESLITNFMEPDRVIDSEYGRIQTSKWLDKEKLRIGNCRVVTNKDGLIALYRLA